MQTKKPKTLNMLADAESYQLGYADYARTHKQPKSARGKGAQSASKPEDSFEKWFVSAQQERSDALNGALTEELYEDADNPPCQQQIQHGIFLMAKSAYLAGFSAGQNQQKIEDTQTVCNEKSLTKIVERERKAALTAFVQETDEIELWYDKKLKEYFSLKHCIAYQEIKKRFGLE